MNQADQAELLEVTCGNQAAAEFLWHWIQYVHAIDDLVDGHRPVAGCPAVFATANALYSSPYYLTHAATLAPVVQLVTAAYEDANELADRPEDWAHATAETLRHCGGEMIRAVALICGGYHHARRVSLKQWEHIYRTEANSEGAKPRSVEMLVTVRKPELFEPAVLTLRTLRVGFPTAALTVYGNSLTPAQAAQVQHRVELLGGTFQNLAPQRHDHWLLWRIESSHAKELVILDGDLIFHRNCEELAVSAVDPLVGPFEPRHHNPLTGAEHQPRLHTCFWRVNPSMLRAALDSIRRRLPRIPHVMPWHATAQLWLPGEPAQFHDTGATLCAALGIVGPAAAHSPASWGLDHRPQACFGPDYAAAFTHLHCGSWSDVAQSALPDLPGLHAAAVAGRLTPELCAQLRAAQRDWYQRHAVAGPHPSPQPSPLVQRREREEQQLADDLVALSHRDRSTLELALRHAPEFAEGLEIGAYRGETSRWLLTHGIEHLTVVDPFTGPAELGGRTGLRAEFDRQTTGLEDSLDVFALPSADALPLLCARGQKFGFIYVDGSHDSRDVLTDAVLAWQLLAPGGVLVFDDYEWPAPVGDRHPRVAIDAFLTTHAGAYTLLAKGYQVAVQKPAAPAPTVQVTTSTQLHEVPVSRPAKRTPRRHPRKAAAVPAVAVPPGDGRPDAVPARKPAHPH